MKGSRASLTSFEIEDVPREQDQSGTSVEIVDISEDAAGDFEETTGLRQRLLTEFALHLNRYDDFSISFLGTIVDPAAVIDSRVELEITIPEGVSGRPRLTVIEWKLSDVDRRLYLCNPDGAIIDEIPPGVRAAGAEFTAYLEWDGFTHDQGLLLDGDTVSPAGRVVQAAREALRKHLAESMRHREVATVQRWRAEGIYPYKDEPKSAVEKATRWRRSRAAGPCSRRQERRGYGDTARAEHRAHRHWSYGSPGSSHIDSSRCTWQVGTGE